MRLPEQTDTIDKPIDRPFETLGSAPTIYVRPSVSDDSEDSDYADGEADDGPFLDPINTPPNKTTRARLRSVKEKSKDKAKKLFSKEEPLEDAQIEGDEHGSGLHSGIDEEPAFNPAHLDKQESSTLSDVPHIAKKAVKKVASVALNPKRAIQKQATKTSTGMISAGQQQPYLSHEDDRDFLNAHDNLLRAQSSQSLRQGSDQESDDETTKYCRRELEGLEAHRESLRVAWVTSRHIDRVRVVPHNRLDYPRYEAFIERDESGAFVRHKWERWLGYVCSQFLL